MIDPNQFLHQTLEDMQKLDRDKMEKGDFVCFMMLSEGNMACGAQISGGEGLVPFFRGLAKILSSSNLTAEEAAEALRISMLEEQIESLKNEK